MRCGSLASLALVLFIAASALANAVRAEKASLLHPSVGTALTFSSEVDITVNKGWQQRWIVCEDARRKRSFQPRKRKADNLGSNCGGFMKTCSNVNTRRGLVILSAALLMAVLMATWYPAAAWATCNVTSNGSGSVGRITKFTPSSFQPSAARRATSILYPFWLPWANPGSSRVGAWSRRAH
jgi:hypothetical protein